MENKVPRVATVVTKAVLIKIALQVLLRNAVIHASDSSLNQRPKPFDGIRVNVSHNVDARAVIDALVVVLIAMAGKVIVGRVIVAEDDARRQNILLDDREQRFFLAILGNDGLNAAMALYHSKYGCLGLRRLSKALSGWADSSFVNLDAVSLQLHILGKQCANLAKHTPSCFVGNSRFPLNLFCRDSAARRSHQVHRVEPQPQGRRGLLKDRSRHWGDHASAVVASVGRASSNAVMLPFLSALLAVRNASRHPSFLQILKTGVIGREHVVKVLDSKPQLFWNALFNAGCPAHGNQCSWITT